MENSFSYIPLMKRFLFSALTISYVLSTFNHALAANLVINNNEDKLINSNLSYEVVTVGSTTNSNLTVSNGGELTVKIFHIGFNGGSGEANIIEGGKVIIDNSAYSYPFGIGSSSDGSPSQATGVLNISGQGSEVISTNTWSEFTVGNKGSEGYINISDGGKLTVGKDLWLGSRGDDTTKGFVNVHGNGSEIVIAERLIVGTWNYGSAIFSDGATLISNGQTSSVISVGNQADNQKDNLLLITGNNTTATATNGGIVIGNAGRGTLIVSDGVVLSSAKDILIASASTANGELAIGGRKGEQASNAGVINANSIRFGAGNGLLVFNHTNNDYVFNTAIHGKCTVEALSGTTILTGANDYSGYTNIGDNAVLQAGDTNTFSRYSSYMINAGGELRLNGYNQTISTLSNAGLTNLSGVVAGTVLTVAGDYTGQDGHLVLGTKLGDDSSITDKLVVEGNVLLKETLREQLMLLFRI